MGVTYFRCMEPEGMSAESLLGQVFLPDKKRYKRVKGKTARFAFWWVCVKISGCPEQQHLSWDC